MNGRIARWTIVVAFAAVSWSRVCVAEDQTNDVETAKLDAAEKQECINHLKLIYDAVQAYRVDHKDLPFWLSDLVPQYLTDANVLICPVAKRTGKSEVPGMADPKIPCSYLWEFSPQRLGKALSNNPTITRREWKRRQMGLVGSVVPIVRCRLHKEVLNLAFDGKIYESGPSWEALLTNRINPAELGPNQIFAHDERRGGGGVANADPLGKKFPARDRDAKAGEIDLTKYYNAMLTESWHGNPNNDLSSLPTGLQTFDGVEYDVRGIVQLGSKSPQGEKFPSQIKGIKVNQKCRRLHFLHAAGFGGPKSQGKQVGMYVVHYAANQMRLDIPIVYGQDVRDWHRQGGGAPESKQPMVAWTGENESTKDNNSAIELFETTWTNVAPDVKIESIDYVSAMLAPAPFLIAITTD
jgi:hypothetical protein